MLILIGSKFRYVLYKYMFDQYRSKELTSINIMTLVVVLVEQVRTVLIVLYGTLMVINDTSLQYITGGTVICSLLMYELTVHTRLVCDCACINLRLPIRTQLHKTKHANEP